MSTAKRIRELRLEKGFTIEELAICAECSKSYIWEIENRELTKPSAEKLISIAGQLGVTVEYLLLGSNDREEATDKWFYEKYKRMDSETKSKIRMIAEIIV
jgi:transcriptional regulator with XRE-family HTH domain